MARVTYVKKAQQRFATVPVIDPATGEQKQTPVMRTRKGVSQDGTPTEVTEQKTTKTGRPVFMKVTRSDKSQPLPNRTCGKCGKEIEVGQPYKHISPKSGPYGGATLYRCDTCPAWHRWEYNNSTGAQVERIVYEAEESADNTEATASDIESAMETAASEIRELAEQKREGSENIESGFGCSTSQSEEMASQADDLEAWADEIEGADIPEGPEPEEEDCEDCEGDGYERDAEGELSEKSCETCDGAGQVTPEEPSEEQMDEWRNEVADAISVLGNSPL